MNNLQQEIIIKDFRKKFEVLMKDTETKETLPTEYFTGHKDMLEWLSEALEAVRLSTIAEFEKAIEDEYKLFGWDDGNGNYASEAVRKLKEEKKR